MTTTSPTRAQLGFGLLAVVVLGWIVFITATILAEPPTGEPDLNRLAASAQSALTTRNADDLGRLLDYPHSDVDDFAASYVATIGQTTTGPVRVVVAPDEALDVSGRRVDGSAFSYPLKATRNDDGRWVLSFGPPL